MSGLDNQRLGNGRTIISDQRGVFIDEVQRVERRVAAIERRQSEDALSPLLPPSTYDRLSPEVDSRLRALNDVLSKFLRLQVLGP